MVNGTISLFRTKGARGKVTWMLSIRHTAYYRIWSWIETRSRGGDTADLALGTQGGANLRRIGIKALWAYRLLPGLFFHDEADDLTQGRTAR